MGDFANRVFAVVRQVPRGCVTTYGQVARLIGAPRAARYVGYALHANPEPGTDPGCIPCHRVVFKDGRMATGFAFGGPDEQRKMLAAEGIAFDEEGRVLLEAHLWDGRPATGASDDGAPLGPPADFDWEAELAD
ncbi:MAG: MGMT family protein [Adlercreutzia sp.]|uniref:MGMT family protein n=1 Tax=uncultured Adlercreutzia sp. TaxID=875803 RepID=UPI002173F0AE|nr:MGMT family protein [uncultured Adlercreutzia sp.]MCI8425145.1 MGMT family protein [Adlercreutzia sp.]